jgi:hypothetical protein
MKTSTWLLLMLATAAGLACAQDAPLTGIAESTDPAKIAKIEQRAQELAAKQAAAAPMHSRKMGARHHRMHKAKPAAAMPKPDMTSGG